MKSVVKSMLYVIRDRKGNESIIKESKTVKFFYGTVVGRCFVKIFSFPIFSKIVGVFLSSSMSKFLIKGFVRKNNIDISLFEKDKFSSFNDFFTRRIKEENIHIDMEEVAFVSPSDADLMVYNIDEKSQFRIKESYYSVSDLLGGNPIYKEFLDGYMLVFRLCADFYHRYIYIDNGYKSRNVFIKGKLNTVRPIAVEKLDVFKKNSREYSILHTENFDTIVQVEVGAVLVGKISNFHEDYEFKKGEEKGMFEFGGSTIVVLVKKGVVEIDEDILNNSKDNIETFVRLGEKIGKKKES